MFDTADLIALPGLASGASDGASRRGIVGQNAPGAETAVLNRNLCHVIEACAMGGHDVALAMSNGELCHASISKGRTAAPELVPKEDRRWPQWTSWPTRHGKVLSLEYDPAHDALVTIEVCIVLLLLYVMTRHEPASIAYVHTVASLATMNSPV